MVKTININEKDYLAYTTYAFKRLSGSQQQKGAAFIKTVAIWCILAIAFMFMFRINSISLSSFHWPSAALTTLPFMAFIIVYFVNMHKLQKSSIPNENGMILGEKTIEFKSEGIIEIGSLSKCFYKWESIGSLEENNGDIYLFVDKLIALIIPARYFSSDVEKEELKTIVRTNTGDHIFRHGRLEN
ncbi:YcxB family protein [Pseudidiomarina marina]|uniref:YcxB family protein n=1 Tax=Pseudidiomarina marina TaxID=502366 RepID=UPI00384D2131